MAGAKEGKSGASDSGRQTTRRGPRRRTRLNLGIPFVPLDDFLNQAEATVALGYGVLEDVVKEIQAGYQIAKDYNKQRNESDPEHRNPPPPIPWERVVERLQNINTFTLRAMQEGNRIFLDSAASGMNATKNLADTLAKARQEADEAVPVLAGPVFDDPVSLKVFAGLTPGVQTFRKRHRGLARLRIVPEVTKLVQLGKNATGSITVRGATFEPSRDKGEEDVNILSIDIGHVDTGQEPGVYEGQVIASNFQLLIAILRIEVGAYAPEPETRQAHAAGGSEARQARARGGSRR